MQWTQINFQETRLGISITFEFEISDLEQIRVLNKQLLEDTVLEVLDNPGRQGNCKFYEFRLSEE